MMDGSVQFVSDAIGMGTPGTVNTYQDTHSLQEKILLWRLGRNGAIAVFLHIDL